MSVLALVKLEVALTLIVKGSTVTCVVAASTQVAVMLTCVLAETSWWL